MWTEGTKISVLGNEREEVTFMCSHKLAWNHNKYFCKDPCRETKDKLVTVGPRQRVESGRFYLADSGDGAFTVTFSQLQLSDSGKYWCAVDRPGLDTFTEILLTVKENSPLTTFATETETATVVLELSSPTWTFENVSNSTQSTAVMNISTSTDVSAALNYTHVGGRDISTGTVLYTTISVVAVLTMLALAVCIRKRRERSKPQPQLCTGLNSAESESDCEYDDIGVELQAIKKSSGSFSRAHPPKLAPPTSASTAAECSVPLHHYENIRSCRDTARSADQHDIVIIKPPATSGGSRHGSGEYANVPEAPENAKNKPKGDRASAGPSRSGSGLTRGRPGSVWFGLDLSGTV